MDGAIDVDALIKSGWTYMDPPARFSHEMWDYFLSIIGTENYYILALTEGRDKNGLYKRGQLVVSPAGVLNMKNCKST